MPPCRPGTAVAETATGTQDSDVPDGLDEDIKAGYFLDRGDRVRVEDWPPYSPFCPVVDMNGYIRMPEVGLISALRRTPASLEIALRIRIVAHGLTAMPVVTPIPVGIMPPATEFFILGEVAKPGNYEFDSGDASVAAAVEIAGGALGDSDGTAVVVDDLSQKWKLRLVRLKAAQSGQPDVQPAVGDHAVIFLPASQEHLEQFIRDVLPYLSN